MFNPFRFLPKFKSKMPLGIRLVVFVFFLRSFGWGIIDPFYSIFISSFVGSYTQIGFLVGIPSLVSLLMFIPLMRLADHVKAARIFEDGQILYFFAVSFFVMAGLLKSLFFLILAFIFIGMATPLAVVGSQSYIRKHDRSHKGTRGFGYYTAVDNFGWVLGMIISAFTIHYYGLNFMFLALLPSVLAGFLILPKIRERGIGSLLLGFRKYFHRRSDFVEVFRDFGRMNPKTFFFLLLSFFDGTLIMYLLAFVPLFALEAGLSMRQIPLLLAMMYLPLVFSFALSQATERFRRMDTIAIGLFIGGASFILLFFVVNQFWVASLAAMSSLSLAIIRPAYNGMLTKLTPRRMLGEITSINNFALRLGYVIGPVAAGFVSDVYGIHSTFLAMAIFAFALGGFSMLLRGYELVTNTDVIDYKQLGVPPPSSTNS